MKVIQERTKCIGCGSCQAVCPNFFEIADDGLASLRGGTKKGENFELEVEDVGCLKEAAEVCPVGAIKIE